MQEDKIKNSLHMIGMEDQFYATYHNPKNNKSFRAKGSDFGFEELSDWNNKKQLSVEISSSLPKLRYEKNNQIQRNNSLQMTDYHSSLLKDYYGRKKQQSLLINPIVIKFNTNVSGNSLRRSQLLFHRILHNQVDKKSEDSKKLREMLKKIRPKQDQITEVLSPPKTERCSGILRMLKRRQQIRIYKRRRQIPQALRAIKLQ